MLLRDKLRANLLLKQYILEVDLHHIGLFNEELAFAMQDRPADVLPLVCKKKKLYNLSNPLPFTSSKTLPLEQPVQCCIL